VVQRDRGRKSSAVVIQQCPNPHQNTEASYNCPSLLKYVKDKDVMVYLIKARIVEPEETSVAREQDGRMHANDRGNLQGMHPVVYSSLYICFLIYPSNKTIKIAHFHSIMSAVFIGLEYYIAACLHESRNMFQHYTVIQLKLN
jgi:hypothetical protein